MQIESVVRIMAVSTIQAIWACSQGPLCRKGPSIIGSLFCLLLDSTEIQQGLTHSLNVDNYDC